MIFLARCIIAGVSFSRSSGVMTPRGALCCRIVTSAPTLTKSSFLIHHVHQLFQAGVLRIVSVGMNSKLHRTHYSQPGTNEESTFFLGLVTVPGGTVAEGAAGQR